MRYFLLLGLSLLLLGCKQFESNSSPRKVYISQVEKSAVREGLTYHALDYNLVVADIKSENGENAIELEVDADQDLYVVELHSQQEATLPGEVVRIGNHAIVKLWTTELLTHLGDVKNYVSKIAPDSLKNLEQTYNYLEDSRRTQIFAAVGEKVRTPAQVDKEQLRHWLAEFSGATEVVLPSGTSVISERRSDDKKALAREWLAEQYRDLGFEVSEQQYKSGINFVADRKGDDDTKTLIVSAHIDSMSNAGADDNGSGVVSALAVAKQLQNKNLKFNLRFVGFDQEEIGLVGSAAYAQNLKDDFKLGEVIGVINIEMTGYDGDNDGAFHAMDCGKSVSTEITKILGRQLTAFGDSLRLVPACTNRSDHASMWAHNIPAIVVSENFFGGDYNPCYHKSCDTIGNINFDYMSKLTSLIGATIESILVAE